MYRYVVQEFGLRRFLYTGDAKNRRQQKIGGNANDDAEVLNIDEVKGPRSDPRKMKTIDNYG